MNERENYLRAATFNGPRHIPISFGIPTDTWRLYGKDLEKIVVKHPILFPNFRENTIDFQALLPDPRNRAGNVFTDSWGCVYEPHTDDVPCYVSRRPLETWDRFPSLRSPDPDVCNALGPIDWDQTAEAVRRNREDGFLTQGGLMLRHGLYSGAPLRNVDAIMSALEKYAPL